MDTTEYRVATLQTARAVLGATSFFNVFPDQVQLIFLLPPHLRKELFTRAGELVGETLADISAGNRFLSSVVSKAYALGTKHGLITDTEHARALPVWFQEQLPWKLNRAWLSQNQWWLKDRPLIHETLLELLGVAIAWQPALGEDLYARHATNPLVLFKRADWLVNLLESMRLNPSIRDTRALFIEHFPPREMFRELSRQIIWQYVDRAAAMAEELDGGVRSPASNPPEDPSSASASGQFFGPVGGSDDDSSQNARVITNEDLELLFSDS